MKQLIDGHNKTSLKKDNQPVQDKNVKWTTDIRFLAFQLAGRTQVISSYTRTSRYGQWTHHETKNAGEKFSFETAIKKTSGSGINE